MTPSEPGQGVVRVPLRGDVWDIPFAAPIGPHPAVVVSANAISRNRAAVTVALVTGTSGPAETHVGIDESSGLDGRTVSYVNATELYTLPTSRLRRFRGRLTRQELVALDRALLTSLGIDAQLKF